LKVFAFEGETRRVTSVRRVQRPASTSRRGHVEHRRTTRDAADAGRSYSDVIKSDEHE
jgi:hypothetical protein